MAATRIGSWSALTSGSLPSGSVSIGAGADRMLVVAIANENVGNQNVTTFTIGGVSYDYSRDHFLEAGSTDNNLFLFVWNEASIASMVGSSIVFAGISNGAQLHWGYATLQDCAQVSPIFDDDGAQASNSHALSTPSSAADWLVGLSMDRSQNRQPLSCDTMTQRLEYSVTGQAVAVFDDAGQAAGASDISTFTNDGIAGDFSAMSAVFAEVSAGKTATVDLGDIDGLPRGNVSGLEWAWYDAVPAVGVFPVEFASDGVTDANGRLTVDISKSLLTTGQTGYLLTRLAGNAWQAIHAVQVD